MTHFFIHRLKRSACLLMVCLFVSSASAQTSSNPNLPAILTVINMLLLGDDSKVAIDVDGFDTRRFSFNNEFDIEFPPGGGQDLLVCFVIESSVSLSGDDLVVYLNDDQSNPMTLSEGENCISVDQARQLAENVLRLSLNSPGLNIRIYNIGIEEANPTEITLDIADRLEWDERAVRKVLKIFAFGGHATTEQIVEWSYMPARLAIVEMLNFDEHNLKLSPLANGENYPISATHYGTLTAWQNFMSDETHTDNPIPADRRDQYGLEGYNFDDAYNRMITVRGLNPFRQKIGFWETNYHLATNLDASVSRAQMAHYYDLIMQAHEAGLPYHQVMGVAAKSAAVAMQYAHRNNRWNASNQECECNDDFAREIHQLFYGIFGAADPDLHENITIPETAKMLTGMPVRYINNFGFSLDVTFNDSSTYPQHHNGDPNNPNDDGVYIFKAIDGIPNINGSTAAEKIDNLMPVSMQHAESLQNLPIMIISVLADDNLSESSKGQLRAAWASMGVNRVFLDFIRAYAISDLFHSPNQFKYLTSHERALYIANKHNLDNLEAYFGGGYYNGDNAGRTVGSVITDDFAGDFFRPLHNVFGGQTALEASDSALAFENHYNRLTDREHDIREAVTCSECDQGNPWEKKWPDVLPQRSDGNYYVSDVAEWLWMHAVGNMDNYTELERAHLYTLLGAARIDTDSSGHEDQSYDFNLMMCVIADYKDDQGIDQLNVSINYLLTDGRYNDYCRENDNGGDYEQHELDELTAAYTGAEIAGDSEIQSVLTDLGNRVLPLNAMQGFGYIDGQTVPDGGATVRRHARERVSYALNFIFTTPFVFAEGGQ